MQWSNIGKFFALSVVSLIVLLNFSFSADDTKIDPRLEKFIRGQTNLKKVQVLAVLHIQKNKIPSPERYNKRQVINYLRKQSLASWKTLEDFLHTQDVLGKEISDAHLHWINNSMAAVVTPEGLKILADSPGIKKIYLNSSIEFDQPVIERKRTRGDNPSDMPYDFADTGLDKLMTEAPEITGKNVVIGSVDTGVDGKHPALTGKILAFYSGRTKKVQDPVDYASHGTHTAGTMVGGNRKDVLIGMAPEAKLVAAGALDDYDMILHGMEYMLDPDLNPSTTTDLPRAINNSWNCNGAPDIELFYRAISAWEATGILPVFSAGNAGPRPRSITKPHEHPGVIAVGATGPTGKIASFSSRGPANFHGKEILKPDLTAPGESIRSSVPGKGYSEMSGTSMAAPHVTGTVALLMQLDPRLNPEQVRSIFLRSVTPTSEDGQTLPQSEWNKVYGYGKLNIYKAAKLVHSLRETRLAMEAGNFNFDFSTDPETLFLQDLLQPLTPMQEEEFDYPSDADGASWLVKADL